MTQAFFDLGTEPLSQWGGPYGLPKFDAIVDTAFEPAMDAALSAHCLEIESIASNKADPDIDNTLAALELSGKALSRVSSIFWCRAGAHSNQTIRDLERTLAPRLSRHFSQIAMDDRLFARIDTLYQKRASLALDTQTERVLERTWKNFVRAGALLSASQKTQLASIGERLALLGTRFGQNVLADESAWSLLLDDGEELAGLPEYLIKSMAQVAGSMGYEGKYALTLSRSITEPFLTFSDNRKLREKVFTAFVSRGRNGGEHDNYAIIAETLALRDEKAKLLGFENYAAFKLEDTMAHTPSSVMALLDPVWKRAVAKAEQDESELSHIAVMDGLNGKIAPWDWRYYANRLRVERFSYDESAIKSYLQLENVIAACFDVAGRLFELHFKEKPGISGWHEDVRFFDVTDAGGKRVGLFAADYFSRPSKRSGAWMSALQSRYTLGEGSMPIIYNIMNFAKPSEGEPALLSLDEARTLFHEFGHALHGLLSEVTWPSIAGTSVARDFVELPSQLFEHWLMVPQILKAHAVHYETGKPITSDLLDKINAARTFDAGFDTVEYTASALVDMAFHTASAIPVDPAAFEVATLHSFKMPEAISMRHHASHFSHIFAGDGYSAGYYSYMWSEVLDADAFSAFAEAGDPFDRQTAESLRNHIYAAGNSADPETLFLAFRGRLPSTEALLKKRGL